MPRRNSKNKSFTAFLYESFHRKSTAKLLNSGTLNVHSNVHQHFISEHVWLLFVQACRQTHAESRLQPGTTHMPTRINLWPPLKLHYCFFYVCTITISVQCVFYVNQAVTKTTASQTLASVTLLPFMSTPNTPVITPTTSRFSQSERKYEMCVCVCTVHSIAQVKLARGAWCV